MRRLLAFLAGSALTVAAQMTVAQELSVNELQDIFQKQKEAFKAANDSGIGQTRGLKLVTVGDVAATTGAQAVAAASTTIAAPSDPNKPLVFGQLDQEIQINVGIKFGFDSATLADSEKPKLAKMCQAVKGSDVELLRIVGHTDSSGSDAYNEELSILRAQEVARHLIDECGIAAARLETVGMGERVPFNAEDPAADENRRVEFQALS